MSACFEDEDWAFVSRSDAEEPQISMQATAPCRSQTAGSLRVSTREGRSFVDQKGELLLEEFMRVRLGDMRAGDGQIDKAPVTFQQCLSELPP